MKEIIILSGIPGSGKSYLAKQIAKKYPKDTVIINNDCIRQMLSGYSEVNVNETYSLATAGKLAELVSFIKEVILTAFLRREDISRIVVDATHFDKKSLKIFENLAASQKVIYVLLEIDKDIALINAQSKSRIRKEDRETIDFVYNKIKAMNYSYNFVLHSRGEVNKFIENV